MYFLWLVSKLCALTLCHIRHSLDVILLISRYKNTVNHASDLSAWSWWWSLHHVIATRKVNFDRRLVYTYLWRGKYTYLTAGVYGIYMTAGAFGPPMYHSVFFLNPMYRIQKKY